MNDRRLLVLVLACALSACQTKGTAPPVEARSTLADSAEQMLVTTRSLLVDRGVQRGEMFADTVYVFDDNTRFDMRKVRVTFNTATGAKDGVMSADRGVYNQRSGMLEGFGNVVLVSNDGKRVFVSNIVDSTVSVIDTATQKVIRNYKVGKGPNGITFKEAP